MVDAEGGWKVWFCERGLLYLTSLVFLEFRTWSPAPSLEG